VCVCVCVLFVCICNLFVGCVDEVVVCSLCELVLFSCVVGFCLMFLFCVFCVCGLCMRVGFVCVCLCVCVCVESMCSDCGV